MRVTSIGLVILLAVTGSGANAQSCGQPIAVANEDPAAGIEDIDHLRSARVRSIREHYPCDNGDSSWCSNGWMTEAYEFDRAGRLTSSRGFFDTEPTIYRYQGRGRFPSEQQSGDYRTVYDRARDGTLLRTRSLKFGTSHTKVWSEQGNAVVVQSPEGAGPSYMHGYVDGRLAWVVTEGMPMLTLGSNPSIGGASPRTRQECEFLALDSGHLQIDTYEVRGDSRVLTSREVLDEKKRPVRSWMLSLDPEQASRNLGPVKTREYIDADSKGSWTRMMDCTDRCRETKRDIEYW